MDDFLGIVVVFAVLFMAGYGVIGLVMDYRYFGDIAKQCAERGYIQDDSKRINCSPEIKAKSE